MEHHWQINLDGTILFPEIIDIVLGQLVSDHPTNSMEDFGSKQYLRTSALVCRLWRDLARPHLFRDMSLSLYGFVPPEDLIWRIPPHRLKPGGFKTFTMLHDLLEQSSSICACVHSLKITMLSDPIAASDGEFETADDPSPFTFLSVLQLLPNLRNLQLCDLLLNRWAFLDTDVLDVAQKMPRLERLSVGYPVRQVDATEVIALLLLFFHSANELYLAPFRCNPTRRYRRIGNASLRLQVHSLVIDAVDPDGHFVEAFRSSPPNLQILHAGPINSRGFESLKSLIDDISMVVSHLGLDLGDPTHRFIPTEDLSTLNLSSCRSLHSLTFRISISTSHALNGQALTVISRILSYLAVGRPRMFRTVNLLLDVGRPVRVYLSPVRVELEKLEEILMEIFNGPWRGLNTVSCAPWARGVQGQNSFDGGDREFFEEVFPRLRGREMLHVVDSWSHPIIRIARNRT